jgi:hypothetical protein
MDRLPPLIKSVEDTYLAESDKDSCSQSLDKLCSISYLYR